MVFYTNFATEFYHTIFTHRSVCLGDWTKKRPKSYFRQMSNFYPYSDASSSEFSPELELGQKQRTCRKGKSWNVQFVLCRRRGGPSCCPETFFYRGFFSGVSSSRKLTRETDTQKRKYFEENDWEVSHGIWNDMSTGALSSVWCWWWRQGWLRTPCTTIIGPWTHRMCMTYTSGYRFFFFWGGGGKTTV